MYVAWNKTHARKGEIVPSGEKCAACISTHRKYFDEFETPADLKTARDNDADLDTRFYVKRESRVQGTDYMQRQGDSSIAVQNKQTQKAGKYVTGTHKLLEAINHCNITHLDVSLMRWAGSSLVFAI